VKWAFDIPSVYLMKKFHSCAPEQLSTSWKDLTVEKGMKVGVGLVLEVFTIIYHV
jgi:hypothetical protein